MPLIDYWEAAKAGVRDGSLGSFRETLDDIRQCRSNRIEASAAARDRLATDSREPDALRAGRDPYAQYVADTDAGRDGADARDVHAAQIDHARASEDRQAGVRLTGTPDGNAVWEAAKTDAAAERLAAARAARPEHYDMDRYTKEIIDPINGDEYTVTVAPYSWGCKYEVRDNKNGEVVRESDMKPNLAVALEDAQHWVETQHCQTHPGGFDKDGKWIDGRDDDELER